MNISSSSTYSVSGSGASGKGISGLASGMDTDSMVEQMLSGTQSKIDDQLALQQQWTWKQEMYREIITSINGFHTKFFNTAFDASSTNNLASADFFNTMLSKVTNSSNFLNIISSSSDAEIGNMNVTVAQLASATKLEGKKNFSSNELSGKVDIDSFDAKAYFASIKVGEKEVNLDLKGLSTSDQIVSKLNEEFKSAGVSATAKLENGRITFISDQTIEIVDGSDEGLAALGVNKGDQSSSAGTGGAGQILTAETAPVPAKSITFTITFNGVSKQISVDPEVDQNGKITEEAVQKALGKSIQEAFGGTYDETTGSVTGGYIEYQTGADGAFTLSTTDGNSFRITDLNAQAVGLTPGSSSTISTSTKLKDLMTKGENGNLMKSMGGTFKFTINGVNFSFDGEDTLGTMINKINSSSAGVKLSYSSLNDGFKLESTSSGEKFGITMSQQAGNVLSLMFGEDVIESGSSAGSNQILTNRISGSDNLLEDRRFEKGATFRININGNAYSYTLKEAMTYDEAIKLINEDLASDKDGYEKFQTADGKPLLELKATVGTDDKLSISLDIKEPGTQVSFTQTEVDLNDADAVKAKQASDIAFGLGFSIVEKNNFAGENTKISELDASTQAALKRIDPNLTDDSTLADLSRSGFSFENGRVVVNVTPQNEAALSRIFQNKDVQKLFGNVEIAKLASSNGTFTDDTVQKGTDAIFYVNGEKVTRNTNVVTVGGITMELTNAVSQSDWVGSDGKPVDKIEDVDWTKVSSATINTERDVDTVVETLKSFVEEYNKMVDLLTGYTDADPNYRKYPPLTEAQRKEMSEKEIEQWEEKSKEGLLRRDGDVESFLSQMRLALYTKPNSSKFALYDIGIDTGTYDQKGKLVFDETALRKALSDDAESVKNLFTDSVNGLSKQLTTIMDNTAKLSSGSAGVLVKEAGMKGYSSDNNNNISERLKTISDKIKELRDKYEAERQRYWNMFSNMESVLSNYNTQSGWLSQQFSY